MEWRISSYLKVIEEGTPIENYSEHQQILNKWLKFFKKNFSYKRENYIWQISFLVKLQMFADIGTSTLIKSYFFLSFFFKTLLHELQYSCRAFPKGFMQNNY